MELNANININNDQLRDLVTAVEDSIDIDDKVESYLIDNLETHVKDLINENVDDQVESYLDDNLESRVERLMDNFNINDYIDINDEAAGLLDSYSPGNGCSLGSLFTEAIFNAIKYMIRHDQFFEELKSLVDDAIKESARKELELELSKELREKYFAEFSNQLNSLQDFQKETNSLNTNVEIKYY